MGALACDTAASAETFDRNPLLRLLDALAERQMRHSLDVIGRSQRARASISSVTQPSSSSERPSISPCER